MSSSFVRDPRTGVFRVTAGAGDGGPEAMNRRVHGHAYLPVKAAGKRLAAGRKQVTIIGVGSGVSRLAAGNEDDQPGN